MGRTEGVSRTALERPLGVTDRPHYARLRALETVPGRPDQLIAGVEAGGIHLSRDGGQTWIDRRDTIVDDVHQVLPISEDVWLASTGYLDLDLENLGLGHAVGEGGLYRTTDAGESWTRLDRGNDFSYIRCAFVHDGTLFSVAAGAAGVGQRRPRRGAVRIDELRSRLRTGPVPGRATRDRRGVGRPRRRRRLWLGLFDVPDQRDDVEGRIMRRTDDGEYETVGHLPANVSRLEVV